MLISVVESVDAECKDLRVQSVECRVQSADAYHDFNFPNPAGTAQIYMLGDNTDGVCLMYLVSQASCMVNSIRILDLAWLVDFGSCVACRFWILRGLSNVRASYLVYLIRILDLAWLVVRQSQLSGIPC